jgi:CheY-like chemotaxis protein
VGSVNPLLGRSVLVVEDEPLIALELLDALQAAGASIVAATNVKEALELIAYVKICGAIVDINLRGGDCSTVCATLTKRSIPFMFYTGYLSAVPLSAWPNAPAISKPAAGKTMVDALVDLIPGPIR